MFDIQKHLYQVICLFVGINLLAACRPIQLAPTRTPTNRQMIDHMGTEWDYLALGDTRTAIGSWPDLYAAHIETDLGVQICVQNWGSGSQTSEALLVEIRENASLRFAIQQAEVLTVWTGGYTVWEALTKEYVSCGESLVKDFGNDLDQIIAVILGLRNPNPTIIRLLTFYQLRVNVLRELGFQEEKAHCLAAYNEQVHRVGARYNIPVAQVHLAFNGPEGDDDPEELGYLKDMIQYSPEGDAVIADLLRELGYEPVNVTSIYDHQLCTDRHLVMRSVPSLPDDRRVSRW